MHTPVPIRHRAALAALLLFLPITSPAQVTDSTRATVTVGAAVPQPPKRLCFRGRPLPECRSFLLTEAAYYWRLGGSTYDDPELRLPGRDLDPHLSFELGGMQNRSERYAVGGTVMAGTGDAGVRLAVKGRYRQWMGDGSGRFDLSAGGLRTGLRVPVPPSADYPYYSSRTVPAYGVTADLTVDFHDIVGISARGELVRGGERTASAIYGGVRLGSYSAIAASAIGGAGLVYLIYALSRGNF